MDNEIVDGVSKKAKKLKESTDGALGPVAMSFHQTDKPWSLTATCTRCKHTMEVFTIMPKETTE